ncbi:MAG: hypothetical protein HY751_00815 [Nitrospinae bacterium]|nr:hypothetical protein [Nitrospinota bacterium]
MAEQAQKQSSTTVVLCPHCKTNQEGVVGVENTCVNTLCGKTFTPEAEVKVVVYGKPGEGEEE